MSDLLASVFSRSDAFKRRLIDALRNPRAALEQMGGNAMDKLNTASDMLSQSAAEGPSLQGPATKQLMNAMADAYNPAGMIVYHGSPHAFTRFDASKIGTGEGAQAYGHGLYLAESPGVANTYKLAGADAVNLVGRDGGAINLAALPPPLQKALDANAGAPDLLGNARRFLANKTNQKYYAEKYGATSVGDAVKVLEDLSAAGVSVKDPGNLYKVDLPDEKIARMLDWDKPLSQQAPEVQAALNRLPPDVKAHIGIGKYDDLKGGIDIVKPLGGLVGDAKVPPMLRQAGIPGIRYLDGGSRGAGQGTSNFVVFPGEEAALTILERNNQPLIEALRKRKGP